MNRLIKFQSVNHNAFSSLANSKLWFSNFHDFNDPFEGRFEFMAFPDGKPTRSLFEKYKSSIEDLAYFEPSMHELIDELNYDDFNFEEFTWVYDMIREKIYESITNDGCLCLSELNQNSLCNQLMWSHYADGLRGFCVVFDKEKLLSSLQAEFQPTICRVNYSNDFPKLDLVQDFDWVAEYISSPPESVGEVLTKGFGLDIKRTKARDWEYESEVRVILENQSGLVSYDPSSISEVIIGHKMSDNDKLYLKRIIRSLSKDIPIRIAGVNRDSYDLIVVDDWE